MRAVSTEIRYEYTGMAEMIITTRVQENTRETQLT